MPQQLALGNGQMHTVGALVEDTAPEQAAEVETTEPEITPCRTAFTVYLTEYGEVLLSYGAWAAPVPDRKPTFDEMYHAAAVVTWQVDTSALTEVDDGVEECLTAFTPYLTHDGRWLISADPADPLIIDREPTNDEIVGGLAVVQRDIKTQEILQPLVAKFLPDHGQQVVQATVQNVIGNMINMGKQAQEAQAAQAIAEQIEKDKQRRAAGGR